MNPFTKHPLYTATVPQYDPDKYHSIGCDKEGLKEGNADHFVLSRSELRRFARNPSKWIRSKGRDATEAMRYGSLLDAMLLAPEYFKRKFVLQPDTYPSEEKKGGPVIQKRWNMNSSWCKEWVAETIGAGHTPYKSADWQAASDAITRLNGDGSIRSVLWACDRSVLAVVMYEDRTTGLSVAVKALIDIVPGNESGQADNLADLKTTNDASNQKWTRHVFDQGYHYQAAMYLDIWNAATGQDRSGFLHIVSESDEPYEPAKKYLSSEYIELGRNEYQRDLELFCRCVKENKWPGYEFEGGSRLVMPGGWHLTEPLPRMQQQAYDRSFSIPEAVKPEVPEPQMEDVIP